MTETIEERDIILSSVLFGSFEFLKLDIGSYSEICFSDF